jgi:hypothetical protein
MVKKLMTTLVARPQHTPIIIVKAPKGTFRAPWDATGVIKVLRTRLPSEQLQWGVVIMDGEPTENPKVFGSSLDSEAYVRSNLKIIAAQTWTPITLD